MARLPPLGVVVTVISFYWLASVINDVVMTWSVWKCIVSDFAAFGKVNLKFENV